MVRTNQPLPIPSLARHEICGNCPHRFEEHDYPVGCTKCKECQHFAGQWRGNQP